MHGMYLMGMTTIFCIFSGMGAAYGTAKSGVGVASMGVMRPELVMKSIVPVVMAGVLGIYGLIIAVIISTGINPKSKPYYVFDGYAHLSSGLSCGLAGLRPLSCTDLVVYVFYLGASSDYEISSVRVCSSKPHPIDLFFLSSNTCCKSISLICFPSSIQCSMSFLVIDALLASMLL
jgi:ATP synthase proteolipid subunit